MAADAKLLGDLLSRLRVRMDLRQRRSTRNREGRVWIQHQDREPPRARSGSHLHVASLAAATIEENESHPLIAGHLALSDARLVVNLARAQLEPRGS